jgi:diamine N-acetyltransferase
MEIRAETHRDAGRYDCCYVSKTPGEPPSVTARALGEADAQYFVDVCSLPHCLGFVHAPTVEQVRNALASPDAKSFVIDVDGRPVGVIRLSSFGEPIWLVEVRLLAIAEPNKGFGITALWWAQDYAFHTLGAHRMYIEVVVHNAAARTLYERCGFTQEKLWRGGFREDDGKYHDLAAYGMLDREYAARLGRSAAVERSQGRGND